MTWNPKKLHYQCRGQHFQCCPRIFSTDHQNGSKVCSALAVIPSVLLDLGVVIIYTPLELVQAMQLSQRQRQSSKKSQDANSYITYDEVLIVLQLQLAILA